MTNRLDCVLRAALILTAPFLAGCYAHQPVAFDEVEPGLEVRAHLTRDGVSAAEEQLGRAVTAVDATVLDRDAEQLLLRIDLRPPEPRAAAYTEGLHQRLALRRDVVVELERRVLDRGRTSALIAGSAAALVAVLRYTLRVRDPGGVTQPPRPDGEV